MVNANEHLDGLTPEQLSMIESLAQEYEAAWKRGDKPNITGYLNIPHTALLVELALVDIELRLRKGEPVRVEGYQREYPELSEARIVLPLIITEIEGRKASAEPAMEEYIGRFPELAAELSQILGTKPGETWAQENMTCPSCDTEIRSSGHHKCPSPGSEGKNKSPESSSSEASFGDYELVHEIARGGMGVVYKARQKSLNRIVALKMIKSGEFANQEQVDRFYKEAEAAANLDHPGIVPIYEVGELNGQHYFTMGFVDGDSLADRLRNGPLSPNEAARYAMSIAEGVAFAHSNGVIHRDLKPGNVLITQDGQVRLTDFGLAKRMEDDSNLTSTGQVLGTPSYMPPEQAAGKLSDIGPAADVYAIGATLYSMLVGRPPFQAANVVETLNLVLESDPVSLTSINRRIPLDLETLCIKCLEKKPSNRYESAKGLIAELARFLNGEPIKARPIGRVERALRWCKRRPAQAAALALMCVLSIGGPALYLRLIWSNSQTAIARTDTLLNASPATIPLILEELDRDANVVNTRLNQLRNESKRPSSERLRLSLALLSSDSTQLNYLKERLMDTNYEELAVVLQRLKVHGGISIAPELWATFHNESLPTSQRFRSGIALAALDPESDQLGEEDYQFLVTSMLNENTVYQPAIRQSLQSVAGKLLSPVRQAFRNATAPDTVQESAANAIVDFAGHDAELLAELSMVATPKQHSILFPPVDQHAESNENILKTFVDVTKLQPKVDDSDIQRVAMGKRRAGAAINLVRMGHLNEGLEVLRVHDDPESLTQFAHGCKDRGVTATDLLHLLNRVTSVSERYGILLALGEFSIDAIPDTIRSTWVNYVKGLHADHPSSGIHGASGWLLRQWGFVTEAKSIEERAIPYTKGREWFTLAIDLEGNGQNSYFTFVVFPAGQYQIGSPQNELTGFSIEEQRRDLMITRSFAVLDREVTLSEVKAVTGFRGFLNDKPWETDPDGASSSMSWYMSVQFCRGLTEKHGLLEDHQCYLSPVSLDPNKYPVDPLARNSWDREGPMNWPANLRNPGFRLPTAAEWEIACRGGKSTTFGFGSDPTVLPRYGWFQDCSGNKGHRPKELRPNHRGLFDMHGNLIEWCHDWSGGDSIDNLVDPIGEPSGSFRALRGGAWCLSPYHCRSGDRTNSSPSRSSFQYGFRIALSVSARPRQTK